MPGTYAHALPKGFRIEEYEIVRVLGAGGFGITYLAFDHELDGPVALKEYWPTGCATRRDALRVIAPSSSRELYRWGLTRFKEEAQALHKLRHPNVVRVNRLLEAHGTAYIVMEYVEGEPLADFLERHGSLSASTWQPWLDRLLDGLAHVHGQGYLHRDITPRNIVIRAADGEPVLIDFGSARAAAAGQTQTQMGTRGYAPIEQYSSETTQGPWTDIYSLAAVSYRVLTGDLPPEAPSRMLNDEYEPLAAAVDSANQAWLAALDHGLALRPEERPQALDTWRTELRRASDVQHSAPAPLDRAAVAALMVAASIQADLQALTELREAAEDGSAEAQVVLGGMYADGNGVPQDDVAWKIHHGPVRGRDTRASVC